MGDSRYRVVVGMLDDPLNRAAITRELLRRGKLPMVPPPVRVKHPGGQRTSGWVFPTLREAMRGLPSQINSRDLPNIDGEVTVYTDDNHWFVILHNEDGAELGPFDNSRMALDEARKWMEAVGYTLLDSLPWDDEDLSNFPVRI